MKSVDSIIIRVYLPGQISGPVSHTNRQKHTVSLSSDQGGLMTKVILHSDRHDTECLRTVPISGTVVATWLPECPYWEKPGDWKKMSKTQRVISHVLRFDEGFGVDFEFLGDGEE